MKPIYYYGNEPLKFAPCEAVYTLHEIPVKAHPAITRIRNKRQRMRAIKLMARRGVKTFLRPVWEIYPPNAQVEGPAESATPQTDKGN
jgi:hypothetical protein